MLIFLNSCDESGTLLLYDFMGPFPCIGLSGDRTDDVRAFLHDLADFDLLDDLVDWTHDLLVSL